MGRPNHTFLTKNARLLGIALFFATLFLVSEMTGLRQQLTVDFLQSFIQQNLFTGFVIFTVLFTIANLVQIPGILFLAGAVLTLGREQGGLFTYGAAVISCVLCFLVIRAVGRDSLRNLSSEWAQKIFKGIDRYPVRSVLGLRVLMQTAPALNYSLALSGVRFRDHLIGTVLGLPLPIALYCVFFDFVALKLA